MLISAMPLLFGATLFLAAALLFLLQLLFARLALPLLGGAPAVWNTAMVFYQGVLLAGYAYAHALGRLPLRWQRWLHSLLLPLPLLLLPFAIPAGWRPPVEGNPVASLLGLLAAVVGLPFFVVSTTSPLLQRWFARCEHRSAGDPYFLYAASNAGSLLGLLAYPLVIEPRLRLTEQSTAWAWGFGILVALCWLCAWRGPREGVLQETVAASPPLTWRRRLQWLALAAVPSSLLLSVTGYLSTDLAAVPLLWVLPLGLYLLTFVIAFARGGERALRGAARALPILLVAGAMALASGVTAPLLPLVLLHLALFFVAAWVCHGRLAEDRPPPARLTEFYLWTSLGGVLGGAFNALLAPVLFHRLTEYPLALVAVAWLTSTHGRRLRWRDLAGPLGVALLTVVLGGWLADHGDGRPSLARFVVFGIPVVLAYLLSARGARFALALAGVLLVAERLPQTGRRLIAERRSFFGVHRVTGDERFHYLIHGKTVHGLQAREASQRRVPLGYYHPHGPLGEVMALWRHRGPVAVVGLGTGASAAYGRAGDEFDFYEIDPEVKRLAQDPECFTYLGDTPARARVILGDARLRLADAPAGRYSLIVLDAYSSDSIPVHLLTREALALYLGKLAPGGLLAFHLSNRHLDLRPVVAGLAEDGGLVGRFRDDTEVSEEDRAAGKAPSRWAVLARDPADVAALENSGEWQPLPGAHRIRVWTDDDSSILPLLDFSPD